ncbi:MAG: hypothetical protein IPJ88_07765 [Myxococcales bacterium]|nr:MAG: hypothetical protein IPJ88_07765 [Myxococcales bacterium]
MGNGASIPPIGTPLALHRAAEQLAHAVDREEVLDLLERFGGQFFEFFVVFSIKGKYAQVRRAVALDDGLSRAAQGYQCLLESPGSFREVFQNGKTMVANLNAAESDRLVAEALGRSHAQPSLIVPVTVRGRVVLLLCGDRGGHDFEVDSFSKLIAFAAHVGNALEMLILRSKLQSQNNSELPSQTKKSVEPRETKRMKSLKPLYSTIPARPSVKHKERAERYVTPLVGPPKDTEPLKEAEALKETEPSKTVDPPRTETLKPMPAALPSEPVEEKPPEETDSIQPRRSWRTRPQEKLGLSRSAPPVPQWDKELFPSKTQPLTEGKSQSAAPDKRPPEGARSSHIPSVPRVGEASDRIRSLVRELSACNPEQVDATIAMALAEGEALLPELVKRFPGELWFNRHSKYTRLARGRDVSAIARALVSFGSHAVPYVAALLDPKSDDESRFYAVLVAADLGSKEQLIEALGRLVFDQDIGIRNLVADVLCSFRGVRELEVVLRPIRSVAQSAGEAPARRRIAVRILGELHDERSVKLLVSLLGTDEPALMQSTQRALVLLTRHDFGTSKRRWAAWLARHGKKQRTQWLIEALMQEDEALRSAAFDELRHVVGQGYGYDPHGHKKDRKAAYRKFLAWWKERHG